MEKRLILAIALSFLVLFGYQALFNKANKPAVKPPVPTEAAPISVVPGTTAPVPGGLGQALDKPEAPAKPKPAPASEDLAQTLGTIPIGAQERTNIKILTSLYAAEWANEGAVLKSWKLRRHKNSAKQDLELVPARAGEIGIYPFSLGLEDAALARRLNTKELFEVKATPPAVDGVVDLRNGASAEVVFSFFDGASIKAEKVFRFTDGVYPIEIEIRVWKDGRRISPSFLWGPGLGNPVAAELKQRYTTAKGAAYHVGGRVVRMPERNLKAGQTAPAFVDWAAYEDQYFTALFVLPDRTGQADFVRGIGENTTDCFLYVKGSAEPASDTKILGFIGPKESDALAAFGHGSRGVINFSKFIGISLKPIAEIMLVVVKYFHKIAPNWGLSIILLTLLIKIIFFPLTYSSTKSMSKMADLQPKVKAIRAKYKKAKTDIDQRRQMNEEMMRLYKEQGVNPAGGCLPLLIQLPVFVAVYQMLVASIEFRHSPFISFWISDLSVMDKTFILPIMMGGTQYISQKMTPTSADPAQAKMMLLMPIIMTFFFAWAQSGLVLYWLTTNVLQIGQQALMNKMMHRHPVTAKAR
jgi:YidC/Oxa1 family membrane protein insertase